MKLEELRDLSNFGPGMIVATRNAQMQPEISEVYGYQLSENGKKAVIYVSSKDSPAFWNNIKDNGQVALSVARPVDDQSGQIKGLVKNKRPMTPEEQEHSRQMGDRYRQEIVLIGMPPEAAAGLIFSPDTALEIDVTALFIQTPGSLAGKAL